MAKDFNKVATDASISKAVESLKDNGIETIVVGDKEAAKKAVLEMLPKGAEIMDMTSRTLESIGLTEAITQSGDYNAVKTKLYAMDRKTQGSEMQKMGSAPQWSLGSVHAVTEDGRVIIASATGSQLPAYAYGSTNVIWVVGAQKIVKDLDEGLVRLDTYTLPLESERARQAYGVDGSAINKLLIINKEVAPGRIKMVLVKQSLGF